MSSDSANASHMRLGMTIFTYLLVLLGGLSATAGAQSPGAAQSPMISGEVAVYTEISRRMYCRGDRDVAFLELEVMFRFQNLSNDVVLIHKGIGADQSVLVAKDSEAMSRRDYENRFSFTSFAAESEQPSDASVQRLLVALGKKESFVTRSLVRLPFRLSPNVDVGITIGHHVIQLVFPGWPERAVSAEVAQARYKPPARVFKSSVRSPILSVSIPDKVSLVSCP